MTVHLDSVPTNATKRGVVREPVGVELSCTTLQRLDVRHIVEIAGANQEGCKKECMARTASDAKHTADSSIQSSSQRTCLCETTGGATYAARRQEKFLAIRTGCLPQLTTTPYH
jgi:hypothetical protein